MEFPSAFIGPAETTGMMSGFRCRRARTVRRHWQRLILRGLPSSKYFFWRFLVWNGSTLRGIRNVAFARSTIRKFLKSPFANVVIFPTDQLEGFV